MSIEDSWEKALTKTEIIRARLQDLLTFSSTRLPYVLLSESVINIGDTVVRKGTVTVEKPALILPMGLPQFEGFKLREELHIDEGVLADFFLVRGIKLPSMIYNNQTYSMDIVEEKLQRAIDQYKDKMQEQEDIATALIAGPQDVWQLSVLLYVCTQVIKSAEGDIKKLIDELRKKGGLGK